MHWFSRGTGNETNFDAKILLALYLGNNNVGLLCPCLSWSLLLGLQETLGNGAMSNSIADIEDSDCLLVFGYNCADSHPIVAPWVKAKQKGPKLLFVIPEK